MNESELSGEAIAAVLQTRWLGRPVYYYRETGSTNEQLQELAAGGAPAGTLVISEYQSAGRGRGGRRWEAPAGSSLLFSVLFRPGWRAEQGPWLTMIAGLAVVRAIREEGEEQAKAQGRKGDGGMGVALKWPNDVMLRVAGEWRKAGGLLLAAEVAEGRLLWAVMGIGLNVNVGAEEMPQTATPATSLLLASGRRWERPALLARILQEAEGLYEAAEGGQSPQPAWDGLLVTRGRPVRVRQGGTVVEGMAEGTDEWGRLLVRDGTGVLHRMAAGEVTLRAEGD